MNPALTPLSRIREMTNAELVAFAKEHSHLTILEREFLRRMEEQGAEQRALRRLPSDVQSIVEWARERDGKQYRAWNHPHGASE